MKKIHFNFLGVFRRKNDKKREENARNRTWGAASGTLHLDVCTWARPGAAFCYRPRRHAPPSMRPVHGCRSKPTLCCIWSWVGGKSPIFST